MLCSGFEVSWKEGPTAGSRRRRQLTVKQYNSAEQIIGIIIVPMRIYSMYLNMFLHIGMRLSPKKPQSRFKPSFIIWTAFHQFKDQESIFLFNACILMLSERQTPSNPKHGPRSCFVPRPSQTLTVVTPVMHHLRYDQPHGVTRYLPPVHCCMRSSRTKYTVVRHGFLVRRILLRKTMGVSANADAMRGHP